MGMGPSLNRASPTAESWSALDPLSTAILLRATSRVADVHVSKASKQGGGFHTGSFAIWGPCCPFGTFLMFQDLPTCFQDCFLICSFLLSLSRPIKCLSAFEKEPEFKEHSRKGPGHNQNLRQNASDVLSGSRREDSERCLRYCAF